MIVVAIERAPAAVAVLHGQHPTLAALDGAGDAPEPEAAVVARFGRGAVATGRAPRRSATRFSSGGSADSLEAENCP